VITHAETRQIFGTTRFGRPSRFLSDLPEDTVELVATRAASHGRERYVDRAMHARSSVPRDRGSVDDDRQRGSRGSSPPGDPWRHPQSAAPARAPELGERFVDREFFDDHGSDDEVPLRRGSRVFHTRFGEGEVRRIEHAAEPTVIAFFPGWGEKKILARFLKMA
jgi:DNA helicase-2/ATP-dependent DNA helicase PcrA